MWRGRSALPTLAAGYVPNMLPRPPDTHARITVVHGGSLSGPARRAYLTWIRNRALAMYARAGRELAADTAPWEAPTGADGRPAVDRPDVDDWIRGAVHEAGEVFATDLAALDRPGIVRRSLRGLARWLWALST